MKMGNLWNHLVVATLATLLIGMAAPESFVRLALAQGEAQQESPFKDRAEYDAFNAILQAGSPNQQIELADKYLSEYPETKLADKVYEIKLQAYQQLNDGPKMEEAAKKLLEVSPDNFRALLLLSYIIPRTLNAQDPGMEQKLTAAEDYARRGLEQLEKLQMPEGMSAGDFQKQKDQSAAVLHQTTGFVALQRKNYEQAAQALKKSGEMNPDDALDFYWLGLAYLSPKPPQYEQGIWAMARALSIKGQAALPTANQTQVRDYVTNIYKSKRLPQVEVDQTTADEMNEQAGREINDILARAATAPFPPADFRIEEMVVEEEPEPEPEPVRELSVKPEELSSFDVLAQYLQAGGLKGEDTWTLLHGSALTLPGKVVSATPAASPRTIRLAVDPVLAQEDGKYDVELTLEQPLARALSAGQMIQFEGTCDAYRTNPFLLQMAKGKIISQ